MRTSEWIQGGFVALIAVAAWMVPLSRRRRLTVTILAACALAAVLLSRCSAKLLAPVPSSILRDWLPIFITLIPYWQTGQFFTGPNDKFQAWLIASDRWLWKTSPRSTSRFGRAVRLTLEWAYALCYPIVPLGLGMLYIAGLRRDADVFWFLVLLPTYICYVITPFFPALPPRSVDASGKPSKTTKSRIFNLWLLKHGSIQAISFPSAHVASAFGVSLMLWHYLPLAGTVFLVIALWIAIAAVAEGYHYTVDVVLGAVVSLAVYFAWRAGSIPSSLVTAPAIALVALR